jgi:hypothetical protein
MPGFKFVWCFKLFGTTLVFDNFNEGYRVYKEEKFNEIYEKPFYFYPKLMSIKKFNDLKEFTGV